jgi:hypothetical protein
LLPQSRQGEATLSSHCRLQLTLPQRISEIIKRRNKERTAKAIAEAKKEAMGDFSHLKNKKGQFIQPRLPQPTLPNISIDDDLADIASLQKRAGTPSINHSVVSDRNHTTDAASSYDYPIMPAYNAPYAHHQDPTAYPHYNPSVPTLPDESQYYEDDYGSTAHLALGAEAYSRDDSNYPEHNHGSQGYAADPYDVYTGHAANGQYGYQSGQHPHDPPDGVGLAYGAAEYNHHHTGNQR